MLGVSGAMRKKLCIIPEKPLTTENTEITEGKSKTLRLF
jgi:hypothetical protein